MAESELLDQVDEQGNVIGKAKRSEFHSDPSKIHAVVHCWLFNKEGQILWQQRSLQKAISPMTDLAWLKNNWKTRKSKILACEADDFFNHYLENEGYYPSGMFPPYFKQSFLNLNCSNICKT